MTFPSATVIKDSISPNGVRLTTVQGDFHRFVLAEKNTHRVFSRNSASSRAIPLGKMVDRVLNDIAVPLVWASEQKGMQGGDEVDDIVGAQIEWREARDDAVRHAKNLGAIGVHKSIANRLLEPFNWHTAIVTSTAWGNFFEQRCSPLAQPEIREYAEAVREAIANSTPELIQEGSWHLPYIEAEDITAAEEWVLENHGGFSKDRVTQVLACVSAARCARVSYLTHDGRRDIGGEGGDLDLYDKLVTANPKHFSPLEHVATPDPTNATRASLAFTDLSGNDRYVERTIPLFGNFIGWRQLRAEIEAAYGIEPLR